MLSLLCAVSRLISRDILKIVYDIIVGKGIGIFICFLFGDLVGIEQNIKVLAVFIKLFVFICMSLKLAVNIWGYIIIVRICKHSAVTGQENRGAYQNNTVLPLYIAAYSAVFRRVAQHICRRDPYILINQQRRQSNTYNRRAYLL